MALVAWAVAPPMHLLFWCKKQPTHPPVKASLATCAVHVVQYSTAPQLLKLVSRSIVIPEFVFEGIVRALWSRQSSTIRHKGGNLSNQGNILKERVKYYFLFTWLKVTRTLCILVESPFGLIFTF